MPPHNILDIRWSTSDPDTLAARLSAFGLAVESGRVISFPSATIGIDAGRGSVDRLEIADGPTSPGASVGPHPNGVKDVIAVAWATVDTERFVDGHEPGSIEALPRDPHLGAFVARLGRDQPQVLVVEPATEGRLSATLARSGEGAVAIYLAVGAGGLGTFVVDAQLRGNLVSLVHPGPLGPSVIVAGGSIWGPHIVVVERADRARPP